MGEWGCIKFRPRRNLFIGATHCNEENIRFKKNNPYKITYDISTKLLNILHIEFLFDFSQIISTPIKKLDLEIVFMQQLQLVVCVRYYPGSTWVARPIN